MSKIKKFAYLLILLIILISSYYFVYITISDASNLNDVRFWFFSVIAQFNGAVIGLILAALGISFVMHSEKTIFLYKEGDFELLKYTIYIFIVNVFFAFLGLSVISQSNILIGLISLTLIIEIFALIFLGLFFNKSIYIFQNKVYYELNKRDTEKIFKDINIEFSSDKTNLLFFQNSGTPILDFEGIIHPRISKKIEPGFFSISNNILNFPAIKIETISKIDNNSRVQLSGIPKEILTQINKEDNLDFNIIFKFRKMNDFFYIISFITFKKIDEEKLKFIKEPSFEIGSEYIYNYSKINLWNNPYPFSFNFSR